MLASQQTVFGNEGEFSFQIQGKRLFADEQEEIQVEKEAIKRRAAELFAGGGRNGTPPRPPLLPGQWKVGMPCHWQETTQRKTAKYFFLRCFHILHVAASIVYLLYRSRATVGVITKFPALVAYQIAFLVCEIISALSLVVHTVETWSVYRRNSIDFKRIPNRALSTNFTHRRRESIPQAFSNWPSIAVYIPCYNESPGLVRQTLRGAVAIDYPKELLTVYLCDDGKDENKMKMVSALRREGGHLNLHYCVRPNNMHAKAGNLNYALTRTASDLFVTLDADFVARPNLLQRLVPYYYNWNGETSMYEFNSSLACVQTPQHFRNLSPHDADPLDQRSTLFFDVILPGKDYLNASTLIGTTNLLSREPAKKVAYYPCHSVTEDSAMSLAFHSAGYRTYYCNESLAHGLACTTLWGNIGQRSRWLKGDWQILFNLRKGPIFCPGLSLAQRVCYLGMGLARLTSVVNICYEFAVVLLLVFAISPLDVLSPKVFLYFVTPYILFGMVARCILVSGGKGYAKSEGGIVAFETIFRYFVVLGFFETAVSLIRKKDLKFNVTDKEDVEDAEPGTETETSDGDQSFPTLIDLSSKLPLKFSGRDTGDSAATSDTPVFIFDKAGETLTSTLDQVSSSTNTESPVTFVNEGSDLKSDVVKSKSRFYFSSSSADRSVQRQDMRRNLSQVWFSALMAASLTLSIVWGVLWPSAPKTLEYLTIDGIAYKMRYTSVLPMVMALGFAGANILYHLLAVYLAFVPYTKGWMMEDFISGRCDQFAISAKGPHAGKLFVPWSYVSLLSIARGAMLLGSLATLCYFIYGPEGGAVLEPVA